MLCVHHQTGTEISLRIFSSTYIYKLKASIYVFEIAMTHATKIYSPQILNVIKIIFTNLLPISRDTFHLIDKFGI